MRRCNSEREGRHAAVRCRNLGRKGAHAVVRCCNLGGRPGSIGRPSRAGPRHTYLAYLTKRALEDLRISYFQPAPAVLSS